jgi:hypothetical protein
MLTDAARGQWLSPDDRAAAKRLLDAVDQRRQRPGP